MTSKIFIFFIFQNIWIAKIISYFQVSGKDKCFILFRRYCLSRLGIAFFKVLLTHKGFIQIQTLLSAQIYLHLRKTIENKLGLSCAKLSTAYASYQVARTQLPTSSWLTTNLLELLSQLAVAGEGSFGELQLTNH